MARMRIGLIFVGLLLAGCQPIVAPATGHDSRDPTRFSPLPRLLSLRKEP